MINFDGFWVFWEIQKSKMAAKMAATQKWWRNSHVMWRHQPILWTSKKTFLLCLTMSHCHSCNVAEFMKMGEWAGSEARFSKVPKNFRARKAITKILNSTFTELFCSHNFNTNKLTSMQSLNPIHCFLLRYRSLKIALRARKVIGSSFKKRAPGTKKKPRINRIEISPKQPSHSTVKEFSRNT